MGSPIARGHTSDIIGCVDGLFFGLEVKHPGGDYEPIQRHEAQRIIEQGHGVAACVHSPEEAVDVVRAALRRAEASR